MNMRHLLVAASAAAIVVGTSAMAFANPHSSNVSKGSASSTTVVVAHADPNNPWNPWDPFSQEGATVTVYSTGHASATAPSGGGSGATYGGGGGGVAVEANVFTYGGGGGGSLAAAHGGTGGSACAGSGCNSGPSIP